MGNPQSIVDFARTLLGSHYLWGSGGSTPGSSDGVFYRRSIVKNAPSSTSFSSPSVFAAMCDTNDGHFVCAGRFRKIPGGRYADSSDWDLQNYLSGLEKLTSESQWCPYASFFSPRVVRGSNVQPNDGKIVWGEDCRYARHFDCISFVNYVLTQTTSIQWSANINQYGADLSGTTNVKMEDPIVPGDILIRGSEHIGFLCENNHVVQAEDHAHGVHDDEVYAPASWSARRRLPRSIIR